MDPEWMNVYVCASIQAFECTSFHENPTKQQKKETKALLTFAGKKFFKGLFPPKAFLQGWPENKWSIRSN